MAKRTMRDAAASRKCWNLFLLLDKVGREKEKIEIKKRDAGTDLERYLEFFVPLLSSYHFATFNSTYTSFEYFG